jgi:hypothetical protein
MVENMTSRDGHVRRLSALVFAGVFAAAGCGSATEQAHSTGQPRSGIVGQSVALVCGGASSDGQGCRQHPVLATIEVLRTTSHERVTTVHSNRTGRFRVNLAPGTYRLQARNSNDLIWARAVTTRVLAHRITHATITFVPHHPLPVATG